MGTSHYAVADHFARRSSSNDKKGNNVYTGRENTHIYSYGPHFVMAYADDERKLVIVNGDRYGVTTSRHQSITRSALRTYLPKDYREITVPYSVLRSAGVEYQSVDPVAVDVDFEDARCIKHNEVFYSDEWDTAYVRMNEHIRENGYTNCETKYEHRLGGSVFRAKMPKYHGSILGTADKNGWVYFLSAFDDTHNRNTDGYFVSQLRRPVKTVAEAFDSLKPLEVRKAIAAGLDVKRQGDAFAIPVADLKVRKMARSKATLEDHYANAYFDENDKVVTGRYAWHGGTWKYGLVGKTLDVPMFPNWPSNRQSHGASEIAVDRFNRVYARGSMYHRPQFRNPEHIRISLGKVWHRIVQNTAVASWQATTARVD